MPFERPISIKEAIDNVDKRKYFLPAIQREFVWKADQMSRLFDSLMRDYPIGAFLFWLVEKEKGNDFQFYEFVKNYSEYNNSHNVKANLSGDSDIIGILDGQQRLTSLYIGLKGSYAYRTPKKQSKNPASYPVRKLYLNLLSKARDNELEYDFDFLKKDESIISNDKNHWFEVGKILDFKGGDEINEYLVDNGLMDIENRELKKHASHLLFKLYSVINETPSINYHLEKDESLDKVLNIFIRVNSGGTQLNYSDLLLSIATNQWKELDAREEIISFVDEINNTGNGFNFNKDFILKTCLIVAEISDIAFKVDNFNAKNMKKIEENWACIKKAVLTTVQLLSDFGYSSETLTSNNATIPIIYYIHKSKVRSNFLTSKDYEEDRANIKKYLILSLIKRIFGGVPDNTLRPLREVIDKKHDQFPLDDIIARLKKTNKNLSFNKEEIESLLNLKYNQSLTFSILVLLYPTLDFRNKFHEDHIHPKSLFTNTKLSKRNLDKEDIKVYREKVNCIGNIQLLEGSTNHQKSDKDFDIWVSENYPDKQELMSYRKKHYIPDEDFSFQNFIKFFKEREKLLQQRLEKILL